jgi:hypothetical protein
MRASVVPRPASVSLSSTPTCVGAADAPLLSFAVRLARVALPAFSGSDDRYCSPAMSAVASRAENRGESSIASRLVRTI